VDYILKSDTNIEKQALVIGAAGIDIVGHLQGEFTSGTSNPANIRTSYGGVARNVAENLARLGQPVKLLTVVGDDETGQQLLQSTANAGVDIGDVLRLSNQPTSTYLAIIGSRGNVEFAIDDMRIINELSPVFFHDHWESFLNASILFIDANLSREALRTVMSLARKAKIPVCADPVSRTLATKLKPYLNRLHLITPNSYEAGILCERSITPSNRRQTMEAAKCLVSQGVDIAIIALGQFGVCYATTEMSGRIPAIQTEIVDPTGAGDALTATVIFAMLNNIPLDDALRLGVSAASLTLSHRGTVLPDLSVEKLYDHLVI